MKFNLNDNVQVIVTDRGVNYLKQLKFNGPDTWWEYYRRHNKLEIHDTYKNEYALRCQFWEVMFVFGQLMGYPTMDPPIMPEIEILC